MSGLVAIATTVLHLTGRVALAVLLAAFLVAYAVLGVVFAGLVALALGAIALPRRLRALGRLTVRRHRPLLALLRDALRPGPTPGR